MTFDVQDVLQPALGVKLQQVSTLEFEPTFIAESDTATPASPDEPILPSSFPVLNKPTLVGPFER